MLADLRDVSIILLALESIVIGIILLLLLWQIRLLVLLLRDEIGPILRDTQETTQTVQSTTKFVGKRVAKPFVNTISFFAGVRGALKAMTTAEGGRTAGSAYDASKARGGQDGVDAPLSSTTTISANTPSSISTDSTSGQ